VSGKENRSSLFDNACQLNNNSDQLWKVSNHSIAEDINIEYNNFNNTTDVNDTSFNSTLDSSSQSSQPIQNSEMPSIVSDTAATARNIVDLMDVNINTKNVINVINNKVDISIERPIENNLERIDNDADAASDKDTILRPSDSKNVIMSDDVERKGYIDFAVDGDIGYNLFNTVSHFTQVDDNVRNNSDSGDI
jgi:hypothetical protein